MAKLGGDSLREEEGDAGADANELDVGDLTQTGEDFVESVVGEKQGIPTGEEDVANGRGLFEVFESGFPLSFEFLVGDTGDDARARAVATVGGAAVGNEEENTVGVAVDQAGDGHVGVFTAGI